MKQAISNLIAEVRLFCKEKYMVTFLNKSYLICTRYNDSYDCISHMSKDRHVLGYHVDPCPLPVELNRNHMTD